MPAANVRTRLQASGASPFTFCPSAISTCQPAHSSWSWTKRAVHRLDRGADRLAVTIEVSRRSAQTIEIRRRRAHLDCAGRLVGG
jgi:hypothetical protein